MKNNNIKTIEKYDKIIAELSEKNDILAVQNNVIVSQNNEQAKVIEKLTNQLEWFKRNMFGSKSEKFRPIDNPTLPWLETMEEPKAEPPKKQVQSHDRKTRDNNGWSNIPENLPREAVIIDVPEEERVGMKLIGYEVSERYARRETCFFVKVIKRAKYADPKDANRGVMTAKALADFSDSVSGKTKFDTSFVAGVIADKMENHLPLYRQAEMMKQEGLNINRSTLQSLFTKGAIALEILYNHLEKLVNDCPIIHGDESTIKLIEPGRGKCKTAYMWVKMSGVGPPIIIFYFKNSRSHEIAKELYKDYYGTIIHDQYEGYDKAEHATHAACWAHVRRKFFEANERGYSSNEYMLLISQLYQIEHTARTNANKKGTATALASERKRGRILSQSIVDDFFSKCKNAYLTMLPDGLLHKAIKYALNCETDLREFLRNPDVNIDNNPVENIIRPLALGRKNWLFAGSDAGGKHLGILASFAAMCKLNNINFRKYLEYVLEKLNTTNAKDIDTLLPHNWAPNDN
ncbi:MAG: IS66 family transposase [Candidatus Gastranaerophilales bacterium]